MPVFIRLMMIIIIIITIIMLSMFFVQISFIQSQHRVFMLTDVIPVILMRLFQ